MIDFMPEREEQRKEQRKEQRRNNVTGPTVERHADSDSHWAAASSFSAAFSTLNPMRSMALALMRYSIKIMLSAMAGVNTNTPLRSTNAVRRCPARKINDQKASPRGSVYTVATGWKPSVGCSIFERWSAYFKTQASEMSRTCDRVR